MNRKQCICAVLAVLFAAGAGWLYAQGDAAAGGKVLLQLRLKAGQVHKLQMTTNQKISQKIMGQEQDVTQEFGLGYSMEVLKVADNGNATVKLTYNSARMKQETPAGKTEYDSARKDESVPPAARPFAALLGQSLQLEMTPQGSIVKIEGVDKLIDALLKAIELPAGADKAVLEKAFREQFGDEAVKENMTQMFAAYPKTAVGVGESWKKKATMTKPFPMTTDSTWTLKSLKGGVAVLDIQTKLRANPEGPPMKMGPMTIRPDLSGQQSGTQDVDTATGWLKSCKLTQEFSGKLKMEGAPGMTQPMEWPITVKGTVTIESR